MVEADVGLGDAGYEGRRRSTKSDGDGACLRKREKGTTARVLHPLPCSSHRLLRSSV
jgi:hypothetical protein